MKACKDKLVIKATTCNSDTHGLFDYETKSVTKAKFTQSTEGTIYRTGSNNITFSPGPIGSAESDSTSLLHLDVVNDSYVIHPKREDHNTLRCDLPWIPIKTLSIDQNGYKLEIGDKLKLGRQALKVLEIVAKKSILCSNEGLFPSAYQKDKLVEEDAEDLYTSSRISTLRDVAQCRICLGDEVKDLNNPIIAPCNCNGTMKFIHLECLKAWVKQCVDIKERMGSTMISWKSLNCELCKMPYPFAVYFNGKIYELIDYKHPAAPYIIFEHYSKESADSNGICIVSFGLRKVLKVGRHNDNEIRLSDVSVSRHHSALHWVNGAAYIQDCNAKFGTLVLMQRPRTLVLGETCMVQCGRTLLEFSVEKSWSLFGCFSTANNVYTKEEEEETKIAPKECLPGAGKHSVLVVKKKAYSKLLKIEENLRRAGTPTLKGVPLKPCKTPPLEELGSEVLHRQRTIAHPIVRRADVRIREDTFIMVPRGDYADDIDDRDCQD